MISPLKTFHTNQFFRKLFLPILKHLGPGDISIRHHYTGEKILLDAYRHKGYWFHGKSREKDTMRFFQMAINRGDTVIEVGGHIGYMSLYYSQLVGTEGRVIVFEPGTNNLPYIRRNLSGHQNVEITTKAVSNEDGETFFYEENLTGQNNTLIDEYEVFDENCGRASSDEKYHQCRIETVKLDTYLDAINCSPDFIKIDIEGAESLALEGARSTLDKSCPGILVEVTRNPQAVYETLINAGYRLFSDTGQPLLSPDELKGNVCALHPEKHTSLLRKCGWQDSLT